MAATPILCQGTTFSIDDDAGSPVTVAGIKSITGLGSGQASEIDVTTLASTAKEFRMGLQDFGSVQLDMVRNFDDAGQAEMLDAMDQQEQRTCIFTLPTATLNVCTFEGFVTQMTTDVSADGVVTGTATIRITGEPVWS